MGVARPCHDPGGHGLEYHSSGGQMTVHVRRHHIDWDERSRDVCHLGNLYGRQSGQFVSVTNGHRRVCKAVVPACSGGLAEAGMGEYLFQLSQYLDA